MMKNILKISSIFTLLLLTTFVMLGCSGTSYLSAFERVLSSSIETSNTLDEVAETDLSDATVENLSILEQDLNVMQLEYSGMSTYEKITAIRALHESIVETHFDLIDIRNQLRIQFEDMKLILKELRDSEVELSETDQAQLDLWVSELGTIKLSFQATIGLAYAPLRDLRGKYSLENIDLIYTTYEDVLGVLQTREELANRISSIMNEAATLFETYQE